MSEPLLGTGEFTLLKPVLRCTSSTVFNNLGPASEIFVLFTCTDLHSRYQQFDVSNCSISRFFFPIFLSMILSNYLIVLLFLRPCCPALFSPSVLHVFMFVLMSK